MENINLNSSKDLKIVEFDLQNPNLFDIPLANSNEPSEPNLFLSQMGGSNIDDSFGFDDISFIKMDVENHELPVILGGLETIKKNKPLIWLEDLFYDTDKSKSPTEYLIDTLGYKLIDQVEGNFLLQYE